MLGVGGVRALRALGVDPSVFHMNEGHSAFLQLERLRELVEDERSPARCRTRATARVDRLHDAHAGPGRATRSSTAELVERNVAPLVARCGYTWDEFAALGRVHARRRGFGLTPFALRTSSYANGVSALHGEVSREMWQGLWPDRAAADVPIGSVTNGVHARTWIDERLDALLGNEEDTATPDFARAYAARRRRACGTRTAHAKQELLASCACAASATSFDPDALTIGFARRFATYKRADLIFSDPDRLARLLADPERPLQIVLAGKAHPADEGGKAMIRKVVEFAREPRANGRVVFLEDYEMTLARYLVQGVDVWLNNPRRPLEASGTSGMKAALNGVVNCSILDGWWCEGYSRRRRASRSAATDRRRTTPRRTPRRGRALRRARAAGDPRVLRPRRAGSA